MGIVDSTKKKTVSWGNVLVLKYVAELERLVWKPGNYERIKKLFFFTVAESQLSMDVPLIVRNPTFHTLRSHTASSSFFKAKSLSLLNFAKVTNTLLLDISYCPAWFPSPTKVLDRMKKFGFFFFQHPMLKDLACIFYLFLLLNVRWKEVK